METAISGHSARLEPDGSVLSPAGPPMRAYGTLAVIALLTFLVRLMLAARNSYWLDELYSVELYVVRPDSVRDAITQLAETSIHPPLYQFLLYIWVELFGDTEVATRTLSNIYVTLSVVFIHRLVARQFDEKTAHTVAASLALTFTVMFFGLETRSYAQTLMLSTLSSYALLACLRLIRGNALDRKNLHTRIWPLALLCAANSGLLLTHYYNFFFWGAQIVLVAGFLLAVRGLPNRLKYLLIAVGIYSLQLGLFLLIWGRVTLDSYRRNTGRFATESVSHTPLEIIRRLTDQSFTFGRLSTSFVLLLILAVLTWRLWRSWPQRGDSAVQRRIDGIIYLTGMTAGPALVAYLAFLVGKAERFDERYMLYLTPGIAALLVLVVRAILSALSSFLRRQVAVSHQLRDREPGKSLIELAFIVVMLAPVIIPGTVQGITVRKDDWRGAAQDVVAIIESDPDSSYIVYEPAFRPVPTFDYYLRRYSEDVRVLGTMRRYEEARGENFHFERWAHVISEYDYLLIPFVHHRTTDFPISLNILTEKYPIHRWDIDEDYKGIVILSVSDSSASPTQPPPS